MFVCYKFTYLSRTEFNEINCYSYPVQDSVINSSAVINAHPQMCTSFPEPHHMPDQQIYSSHFGLKMDKLILEMKELAFNFTSLLLPD